MARTDRWKELEALKRDSTGQLLLKCARLLDERALERINQAGPKVAVRPAHTRLFPHIDVEGTRLTELARRVGITKQAVGQLVEDLVEAGAVELVPDPSDGRARLVRFTPRGQAAIAQGLAVLGELEAELGERLGRRRLQELHGLLTDVLAWLEPPPPEE